MSRLTDYPLVLFVVSLVVLWVCARLGELAGRRRPLKEDERHDFDMVITATLTLLALIIGFTFSMSVSRYDLRKHYEAEEANAIGTEYARLDFVPEAERVRLRKLLKEYTANRVESYQLRFLPPEVDQHRAQLHQQLWNGVQSAAATNQTAIMALVTSGMNDVLNTQAYAQAAIWNRIPTAAWVLMSIIAVCCNVLIGYSSKRDSHIFLILPIAIAISFLLIADIDSARGGLIRIAPQNLIALQHSLN